MNISKLLTPSAGESFTQGGYGWALAACVLTTLLAAPLPGHFEASNIIMLFLLTVLLVAVRFGRGPAVLAAFLSVALFDFFFVPPHLSFTVHDAQYLLTFAVMLTVALVTGQLAAGLRREASASSIRERQTHALYEMARDLAGALTLQQVVDCVHAFLSDSFDLDTILLLPDEENQFKPVMPPDGRTRIEYSFVRIAFDQNQPVEDFILSGHGHGAVYFPLKAPMRIRGVIMFVPGTQNPEAIREQKPLLATLSSLVAIAVERLHYADVAHATQLQIVSERLRSSILSALSHDLRTPLTALVGLADRLVLSRTPLPSEALESAKAIREQTLRLSSLVGNLLDMARLHAGRVTLRKEWQPVEEVIGASIQLLRHSLAEHPVTVTLPPDMTLIEFDAVLMERVFCNLLENASKYTHPGTAIEISACLSEDQVELSVCDHGPGFPPDRCEALFEMFTRGTSESATPGVGLGLAICHAIIEAHGGTITAANRPQGGACISFTLPRGIPPVIEEEIDP